MSRVPLARSDEDTRIAELEAANARLTAEQPPVPPDRELFDALHIESLINEWFAPLGFEIEQSHIDGLCTVLRRRLLRSPADGWRAGAEAMREACLVLIEERVRHGQERVDDETLSAENRRRADRVMMGYERLAAAIRALPIPSEEKKT